MAVRLVVTITAAPGKGAELASVMAPRLAEVRLEPGCEQYDLFQSTERPDVLVLLERWTDEGALGVHAERLRTRPPLPRELSAGSPSLERFTVS